MWKKKKSPIYTLVPEQEPIEIIRYYEELKDYYLKCEMSTKKWFVQNVKKDWIILDCGANIGYFSILFSRLAINGQVYSFEPTNTYEMLVANLNHYDIKNVTPLNIAVGKQSGLREDKIFRIWGQKPEQKGYKFTTIDDFIQERKLSRVDCIKIDVDSFDFEALQGAEKTLINYNPYVMVELNHALSRRNQSNMEALEWLTKLGYKEAKIFDYDNFLLKRAPNSGYSNTGLQIIISFE